MSPDGSRRSTAPGAARRIPGMGRVRRALGLAAPSRNAGAPGAGASGPGTPGSGAPGKGRPVAPEEAARLALLEEARRVAKEAPTHERALAGLRDVVARSGFEVTVMLEYARYLVRRSAGGTAEEVLALSLAKDGAQPDALELYLDLVRELDHPDSRRDWALERLAADIAGAPAQQRAALDFALPFRLTKALAAIGAGTDRVNRAVVAIDAAYEADAFTPQTLEDVRDGLGDNDVRRAHLTVALGRGDAELALGLLEDAEAKAVPMNALRRAIRRGRSTMPRATMVGYLEAYQRLVPGDGWAASLIDEYEHNLFSNVELAASGFPFPPKAAEPVYAPRTDHVLYLLHNSLPHHSAGYATRTHGLLSELNRIGWDVDGVTRLGYPYDMPGKADMPSVPLHEVVGEVDYRRLLAGREIEKKNPLFYYTERYAEHLKELALVERPAILHAASNHWNGLTAVKVANELGIPSVYEVRGLWEITRASREPDWADSEKFRYLARMEADAARGATKVVAITEALREVMIERGVDAEKIAVVPNGVDSERFTPIPRDEELAAELGVTGKTVIGYVGSVLDYEGITLLMEAAQILARTREDFHVLIVGDGAALEQQKLFVQETGLSRVVTFTGRVPHEDVERYYSLVDITPFPRLPLPVCEIVSPLKPFEAMAMGKAVLASDVAALAEIVSPDLNGLLHEKGSVDSLVEQLARLLDDASLRERLGRQARDWVVEHRDWKRLARLIADEYAELTR
ncbi:glycosyltransferase [Brachybacterium sp. DNPG3]